MNARAFTTPLTALALFLVPAFAQDFFFDDGEMILIGGGGITLGGSPSSPPTGDGKAEEPPSPRLQKLQALEYDRRPSTILKVWSTPAEPAPEPPPEPAPAAEAAGDEAPAGDEAATSEAAAGGAEAPGAAATDSAAGGAGAAGAEATEGEAAGAEASDPESTEGGSSDSVSADSQATTADAEAADAEATDAEATDAEATDAEATDTESTEGEATEGEAADAEATDAEATDTESTEAESSDVEPAEGGVGDAEASDAEGSEAQAEPDPAEAEAAAAAAAAKAAEEAAAAEAEAKRKAYETALIDWEMKTLQRNVTLGNWDEVGTYLAGLTEAEAKGGYEKLLQSLNQGVQQRPNVPPQGQQYIEKNRISPDDVLGLAGAAAHELTPENLELLGKLLRQALDAGHQLEAFLAEVRPRLDEEDPALGRRGLALTLVAANEPLALEGLVPTVAEALAEDDREGLNLVSRYCLAKQAEDKETRWLEDAWHATMAVLAVGEVDEKAKAEALQRAVDIAPKIREELGQTWLDESFTARPERGKEILAAIGSLVSTKLAAAPTDADQRLKQLELQSIAAGALLAAAPELAADWSGELDLLAQNWLREALVTYQYDESTSRGPRMQRDPFGNFYYFNSGYSYRGNVPTAIRTGDILDARPGEAWLEQVDETLRPRFHMLYAQLLLKVSEEAEAFPWIEQLAARYPKTAEELVDEFLRVWAKNHDPNSSQGYTSQYVYFYGFEQRASGIPLTRSKQERNLAELREWVARLRQLPVELDDKLLASAFQKAHSSAEIYRLETIQDIFGSFDTMKPATLAELAQTMRGNLLQVWRDPALQEEKKTQRRQKDIEAEVLRGYELARLTVGAALTKHPESWELMLARAALAHDENNFRHELGKTPEFSARRQEALADFRAAAELYLDGLESIEEEDETTQPFDLWFYAALGASDPAAIEPKMQLAADEIPEIRAMLADMPAERSQRHFDEFASNLFTRMSNVSPGVKFRYVREGLAVVGDNELADEARKVFEYYSDLVTEIQLVTRIDGTDQVGHAGPFGLAVDLRHTREIERESGGFGKYLQNQNQANFGFNYGRPTEDYRDKFEEAARETLGEHFEVLSCTFNEPGVRSKAEPEYGWRVTPYAYLLLKPRGPEVDRIPPLSLDLDFLDTTGYAILPVESAPLPIDAAGERVEASPYEELALTQVLNERSAKDGKLVLEVQAKATGLVPELASILEVAPEGFELVSEDDQGVAVVQFAEDGRRVATERNWTLTFQAPESVETPPDRFTFGAPKVEVASSELFRYLDADMIAAEPVALLERTYAEPDRTWLLWIPAGLAALLLLRFGSKRLVRERATRAERFPLPHELTPFTVLGLLRDIERNNGLAPAQREELTAEIQTIERHYFVDEAGAAPDLERIATTWARRAS